MFAPRCTSRRVADEYKKAEIVLVTRAGGYAILAAIPGAHSGPFAVISVVLGFAGYAFEQKYGEAMGRLCPEGKEAVVTSRNLPRYIWDTPVWKGATAIALRVAMWAWAVLVLYVTADRLAGLERLQLATVPLVWKLFYTFFVLYPPVHVTWKRAMTTQDLVMVNNLYLALFMVLMVIGQFD